MYCPECLTSIIAHDDDETEIILNAADQSTMIVTLLISRFGDGTKIGEDIYKINHQILPPSPHV